MSDTLSHFSLTPLEIAKLPAPIRRKIEAAFKPTDAASGEWMLVGASSDKTAEMMNFILDKMVQLAPAHADALRERNIEKLLEILADDLPRAQVESDLEFDNAGLRAEYLSEVPVLKAAEVRTQSGLNPRNKSEPASRWKREGKLFAIRVRGIDLYPAFQFEDGAPNPVIKKVLDALPGDMSPWQIALWFASGNGWLDGKEPQECLARPDDVVLAARRLAEPAVG